MLCQPNYSWAKVVCMMKVRIIPHEQYQIAQHRQDSPPGINIKQMKERLTLVAFSICILLQIGEAQLCGPSCLRCTSYNNCTLCARQAMYIQNGRCISCNASCSSCVNATSCTICHQGNYLMENRCKPCGSDCRLCLSGKGCTVCSYINGECYNQSTFQGQAGKGYMMFILIGIGVVLVFVVVLCLIKKCTQCVKPNRQRNLSKYDQTIQRLGQNGQNPSNDWKKIDQEIKTEECPICHSGTGNAMTFCRHFFHTKCILAWLQRNASCPLCRKNVGGQIVTLCIICRQFYVKKSLRLMFIEYNLRVDQICYNCNMN